VLDSNQDQKTGDMIMATSYESDIMDTRDLEERLIELSETREMLVAEISEAMEEIHAASTKLEAANEALYAFDDSEEYAEYQMLLELKGEISDYSSEWEDGITLIRDTYFVDYCKELCEDIGDIPRNIPSYIVIDWKATAENLKADYTYATLCGCKYYFRMS
jgi:predicted nuclease with TOPRIM domain